jgi:hypothetical protein
MSEPQHDDEIPLSFDEWAEFSARLQKTAPEERGQLLVEHDLVDAWGRCELHYGTLIANDLRACRTERAQAYAARFTPDDVGASQEDQ